MSHPNYLTLALSQVLLNCMSFIYLREWFCHSMFYYSTLTGAALVLPTDHTLTSDVVLSTLSSLSPLFKEKSDYRLGALFTKVCEKCFHERSVSKTLVWGNPAQV
jgi:hypothetical protein